eukprot:m51a1_g833 hypothetical protein (751) ;mRNA; r:737674-741448
MEDREASDDSKNNDHCECCNGSSNGEMVVCCDGCPGAYHLECLDPPIDTPDLLPEGDWFCYACTAKMRKTREETVWDDNVFAKYIEAVSASNTRIFHLPSFVTADQEAVVPKRRARAAREARGPLCEYCERGGGDQVKCNQCPRTYHLHCLEPPLIKVPLHFVCERHFKDPEMATPEKRPRSSTDYCRQSKLLIDFPIPPALPEAPQSARFIPIIGDRVGGYPVVLARRQESNYVCLEHWSKNKETYLTSFPLESFSAAAFEEDPLVNLTNLLMKSVVKPDAAEPAQAAAAQQQQQAPAPGQEQAPDKAPAQAQATTPGAAAAPAAAAAAPAAPADGGLILPNLEPPAGSAMVVDCAEQQPQGQDAQAQAQAQLVPKAEPEAAAPVSGDDAAKKKDFDAENVASLQAEQFKLTLGSMPPGVYISPDVVKQAIGPQSNVLNIDQLSPLFVQFLAWQRLQQINQQMQMSATQLNAEQMQQIRELQQRAALCTYVEKHINPVEPNYTAKGASELSSDDEARGRGRRFSARGRGGVNVPPAAPRRKQTRSEDDDEDRQPHTARRRREVPQASPTPSTFRTRGKRDYDDEPPAKKRKGESDDDADYEEPADAKSPQSNPSGPQYARLEVINPDTDKVIKSFELSATPVNIGRSGKLPAGAFEIDLKDLSGDSRAISHMHAVLEYSQEASVGGMPSWKLKQLGRNGTRINNTQVPAPNSALVIDGDRLVMGHVMMKFVVPDRWTPPTQLPPLANAQ